LETFYDPLISFSSGNNVAYSMMLVKAFSKKDLGEKLTQEQKDQIDTAIASLKETLASKEIDKIKEKSEELRKVLQDVGTVIYQQAASERAKQQQEAAGE
jgi:molecular chaperone DnaK